MGSLMSIGVTALNANYAALQATGHNISNANTPGYSRQNVELSTAGGTFTGAGFFGNGVDISTVARAHNEFLTREASTTKSVAAADATRTAQLEQLEKVFGLGESGIGNAAGQFFNAFVDVVNKPQDSSARQVVLSQAGELAQRFRTAAERIDALQTGVSQDLKVSVASINALTSQVASLNDKISRAHGSGQEPNDLLDQRELALSKLSELVQITTLASTDGTTSVFMGGGQQLVLGNQASTLVAMNNVYDSTKVQIGLKDGAGQRVLPDDLFSAGSVAGLLRFQQTDITDARNFLGQMATAISARMNEQQSLGLDLGSATSGSPMFSIAQGRVLANSQNATAAGGLPVASYINGNGSLTTSVGLTVTDATELRASDYELVVTGSSAGPYQLTRLSDNLVRTVNAGDTIDGFTLNVEATALPAAGDKFVLQPVGQGAKSLQLALSDPRGIAAAAPVTGTSGVNNVGTVAVAQMQAVTADTSSPALSARLTFTDDSGNYDWELVDDTNTVVRNGSATWQPGNAIQSQSWVPNTPSQRNDWTMTLTGVPRSGDTLTVEPTRYPGSNNGNAAAMLAMRDEQMVGQETRSGPPVVVIPGATVTDAYANALADIGVRVQSARSAATQSQAIASDVQSQLTSKTGVNLDEEAARLIQYQQSYQAAAKVLQIGQSLLDTLLQIAR
jgi:flagellar hook-associated protein 1 FlgK